MVKHVNGYLITKNIGHKCLVKVRPFRGAKIQCMDDYSRPTIREFDPEWIIIHVGTNDLNTEKTASQISKSLIDFAHSLHNDSTKVAISLIIPRMDNLNNKATDVNDRLRIMCSERNIPFIDHSDYIQTHLHIDEDKLHLSRCGTVALSQKFTKFISKLY